MRETILEELRFSVSVVLSREEVVPRFRVISTEGDWTVFVPLPDDVAERERRMRLLHGFMAWKSATAFVMSTELKVPDVVLAVAVTREDVACACRPIIRKPLGVGAIAWLPPGSVGEEIVALLPRGCVELDTETEAALRRAFGNGGEFEVRRP